MQFTSILAASIMAFTAISAIPAPAPEADFVIYTRHIENGVEKRSEDPIAFGRRDPSPVKGGGGGFRIYAQYAREEQGEAEISKREEIIDDDEVVKREALNGGGGFKIYAQYARDE
ncbi:hypothetical protein BGZ60DRAFT_532708 [Tricladium varicosporioides]|nr:hypothetical protein BGZ60DRAFT_532708 [Hymenoscyphus varicosporioides]